MYRCVNPHQDQGVRATKPMNGGATATYRPMEEFAMGGWCEALSQRGAAGPVLHRRRATLLSNLIAQRPVTFPNRLMAALGRELPSR
jgi:hypothetical protein